MARIWRKPGTLMVTYLILFGITGVHAEDGGAIVVAAFLAWRVTRGGQLARGLLFIYPAADILRLLNSPGMRSGSLVSLGLLAACLAQIGLLVSTPVYDRTRKNQVGPAPDEAPLWVLPPRWMPVAAAAAGVIITHDPPRDASILSSEGAALWRSSELASEASGKDVADHYATMARVELEAYQAAVTDWELRGYFERI